MSQLDLIYDAVVAYYQAKSLNCNDAELESRLDNAGDRIDRMIVDYFRKDNADVSDSGLEIGVPV
jgi:hypothetical protein